MAVKKGLKGLLNQNSQEILAAMPRDPQTEKIAEDPSGGVESILPVSVPTSPASPVTEAPSASPVDVALESVAEGPTASAPAPKAVPVRQRAERHQQPAVASQPAPEAENEAAPAKKPSWEEMGRKEVRVYSDQVLALTTLRMRINKGKKGSERITDNTLIRVAIDLLLLNQDSLSGTNESELRMSVTSRHGSFGTSGDAKTRGPKVGKR